MTSWFTKTVLFLSSYSPLFAILGFRVALSPASYALWAIAGASIVVSILFFTWASRKIAPHLINVESSRARGEGIAYVVTYIIPFVAFDQTTWTDWAALGLLLAIIGVLYISSPMIHINPVLTIFGWRTYEVSIGEESKMLMSRRKQVRSQQTLRVVTLDVDVILEAE